MSKQITFYLFRYHLLPLSSKDTQLQLFPEAKISAEEIKKNKNAYFSDILKKLDSSPNNTNPLKLYDNEEEYYLFKIANKRTTKLTKNFSSQYIENEPYVYVIINNDPLEQKIAISENIEAFGSYATVQNILRKVFIKQLKAYGLNIEIEQMFNKVNFWKLADKHKYTLTMVNFRFIKPNLANISRALPQEIRRFSEKVNGHESNFIVKAPENGILENIDESNQMIKGLVDYSAEGGGSIKLKVKNVRKLINSNESIITVTSSETIMEGAPTEIIKSYKSIFG